MGLFGDQIRQTFRRLARAPLFGAVTLVTLAVGIGANTAIFSVIEDVLIKPLAYPHSEQLITVAHTAPGLNMADLGGSPANYYVYRDENRTFQDIGLYNMDSMSVTGLAEPEQVSTLDVTDGMLGILGVQPMLGRGFTKKDDTAGNPETVILTWGYWKRRFGGDPGVLGRRIMVDGKAREVIGVMPAAFQFLDAEPQPAMIVPLQFNRNETHLGNFSFAGMARLKAGVTVAQASADVTRMLPIMYRSFPAPKGLPLPMFMAARLGPKLRPVKQDVVGDVGDVLWVLMGTIGLVLLIACANIASLLLVRAEGRRQELAIRAALGASWKRIAAELFSESLTLGVIGGLLGLGVAYIALRALTAAAPEGLPRRGEIQLDGIALLFTVVVSLLAGLLCGAIPVFKYAGPRLGATLRGGGRNASTSRERLRARSALVVAQVALALVLMVSSGLMIRTFVALTHVQPGFTRPEQVQTLQISIPEAQVKDPAQVARMQEEILRAALALPGVSSGALFSALPMDGTGSFDPVFAEDRKYAEGQLPPIRRYRYISPGSFQTTGNQVIDGRDLTWTDIEQRAPVALVSQNLAHEYWGSASAALGKRIREGTDSAWREIVGVVADERTDGVNQPAPATAYWPMAMTGFYAQPLLVQRTMDLGVRSTRAGSASLIQEMRQAVWSVDKDLPVAQVRTLDQLYRKSMARTSFTLVMLALAGGMALLLGVLGIYGVIAYSVTQRKREIGIRMALGAREAELARMFVRQGLLLTGIGLACGLLAAAGLMRLMSSLLFGVQPLDMATYAVATAALVTAAVAASWLPSRRAAAVNPIEALRME